MLRVHAKEKITIIAVKGDRILAYIETSTIIKKEEEIWKEISTRENEKTPGLNYWYAVKILKKKRRWSMMNLFVQIIKAFCDRSTVEII